MKPFCRSVWISPAASGAVAPRRTVQARHFVRPDGEEGLQAQQVVGQADHAVQAGFFDAVFLQESRGVLGRQLGNIHLQLALQRHHLAVLVGIVDAAGRSALRPG